MGCQKRSKAILLISDRMLALDFRGGQASSAEREADNWTKKETRCRQSTMCVTEHDPRGVTPSEQPSHDKNRE